MQFRNVARLESTTSTFLELSVCGEKKIKNKKHVDFGLWSGMHIFLYCTTFYPFLERCVPTNQRPQVFIFLFTIYSTSQLFKQCFFGNSDCNHPRRGRKHKMWGPGWPTFAYQLETQGARHQCGLKFSIHSKFRVDTPRKWCCDFTKFLNIPLLEMHLLIIKMTSGRAHRWRLCK